MVLFLLSTTTITALAQSDAASLVREGVQLNDQRKYAEAIEKYKSALAIDPANIQANYEMAFSLYSSGKGLDGVPFVQATIKGSTSPSLIASSYELLGSIYDQANQAQNAIDAYQAGIKINPNYQRLHYNLGITYFRNNRFADAEQCAIDAVKLDPKHASSQRLYALVCFHQNKRMNALLGFCSFILLEPATQRSTEAYNNIQHILQGGVLKDANGNNTIQLSPKDNQENSTFNLSISMVALSAQKSKLTGEDLLEYEFKHLFTIAGELQEKKTDKTFFDKFFVDYFYKLAQSSNIPAFTHTVTMTVDKDAAAQWGKAHLPELNAMSDWLQKTERGF